MRFRVGRASEVQAPLSRRLRHLKSRHNAAPRGSVPHKDPEKRREFMRKWRRAEWSFPTPIPGE
jgi:hypothetical protein